ncbi:MAG TPA: hypothetical protein VFU21_27760, partial [Kofleriaceae bacterium]|nr:hypothetical protein [Kofleriaceae bacterium]
EGNDNIHAQGKVRKGGVRNFAASIPRPAAEQRPWVAAFNGWYKGTNRMTVSVMAPNHEATPPQPVITGNQNPAKIYELAEGAVRVTTPGPDPANGDINFFVEIQPAPAPAAPAAATLTQTTPIDRHPGRAKRMAGIGLGAAGAAFLVISVYHGLKARGDANELDSFYEDGGPWTDELAEREDSLDRNRTRAIGFGLVGAVALTGGGIFYWMGNQDEKRAAQLGVTPGSNGAVVSWSGSF